MLLFHDIIQKNINFLRRSSKKDDFIIENIFEEMNIIDDIKIIELYFERGTSKQSTKQLRKLCITTDSFDGCSYPLEAIL